MSVVTRQLCNVARIQKHMFAARCVEGSYPVGTNASLCAHRAHAGVETGQAKRLPMVHAGLSAEEITVPVPTAAKTTVTARRSVPPAANPVLSVVTTQCVASYVGSHARRAQRGVPGAVSTASTVTCPVLSLAISIHVRRDVISSWTVATSAPQFAARLARQLVSVRNAQLQTS